MPVLVLASGRYVEMLVRAGGEIVRGKFTVQENGIPVVYTVCSK